MWSLGCIVGEMLQKSTEMLFDGKSCFPLSPNELNMIDENDQLAKILAALGPQMN